MKKMQPIFVIDKVSVDTIFKVAKNHTFFPDISYGTISSKEELDKALKKLPFENGVVLVSKVIDMLNEFYSGKLTPRTNSSLEKLKQGVRAARKYK